MSVRNKILFFILLLNLLFLPLVSKAVYNLSPFYAKVSQLVYSFIGDVPGNATGFISNGVFFGGDKDGQFNYVKKVVIDTANDRFYSVEGFVDRVQKFVLSTGAFVGTIGKSTVANGTCAVGAQSGWCAGGTFQTGSGDGEFDSATDLRIDLANDRLYVSQAYRISKFVLSTGAYVGSIGKSSSAGDCSIGAQTHWCTGGNFVSGTTDGTFDYAIGLEIDATNDFMYVVDDSNFRIEKFVLSTGAFVGAIGNSVAQNGCLGGAQAGWCVGGNFSSGSSDGMFDYSGSVAIDPAADYMYINDDLNRRIQRFVLSTGAFAGAIGKSTGSGSCIAGKQTAWCNNGVFSSGTGDGMFRGTNSVVVDPAHDRLYVSEYDSYRIQEFVQSTGAFIGIIGGGLTANGTCTVGAQSGWCSTGSVGDFDYGFTDGQFENISTLTIDSANNILYVADGDRLQKFVASTGAFVGAKGANSVFMSNWGQDNLGPLDSSRPGSFSYVKQIAIDVINDRIYSVRYDSIQKSVLSTGAYIGSIGNSVSNSGTCIAGKQNSWCVGGNFSLASPHGDGMFVYPNGIAIDVAGDRMYIAGGGDRRVQKFVLSTGAFIGAIGYVTSVGTGNCVVGTQTSWCTGGTFDFGFADGQFLGPQDIKIDVANDFLYVLDYYQHRVQKFVLSTGAVVGSIGNSTATGVNCLIGSQTGWCAGGTFSYADDDGSFNFPDSMAIDVAGDALFVSQSTTSRVQKFVLSTGAFVGTIGNSTSTGVNCNIGAQSSWCTGGAFDYGSGDGIFDTPRAMDVDSVHGFLYVADVGNQNIQKFKLATGQFVGAIGGSTVSGNCLGGKQKEWCTGGNFYAGTTNGFLNSPKALVVNPSKNRLFFTDDQGLHKVTW